MNSLQLSEIRICFVGDSFVNGTGDPQCLGWTKGAKIRCLVISKMSIHTLIQQRQFLTPKLIFATRKAAILKQFQQIYSHLQHFATK
jgi:hypothetical protein